MCLYIYIFVYIGVVVQFIPQTEIESLFFSEYNNMQLLIQNDCGTKV